jgi:hypothetical protein
VQVQELVLVQEQQEFLVSLQVELLLVEAVAAQGFLPWLPAENIHIHSGKLQIQRPSI